MPNPLIFKNEVGKVFNIPIEDDLTDATLIRLDITYPDKTTGAWIATMHPTDVTMARYVTQAGDLAQSGTHTLSSHVEWPSIPKILDGEVKTFYVIKK
jgi:hypothetical protein